LGGTIKPNCNSNGLVKVKQWKKGIEILRRHRKRMERKGVSVGGVRGRKLEAL